MVSGIRFRTAEELFSAYPGIARDMITVPTDESSLEFCKVLLKGRIPEEAITFCAYLLPERVSIWWGHECLNHLVELLDDQDVEFLARVRNRVAEPLRFAPDVVSYGKLARTRTPGGWIALAAGLGDTRAGDADPNPQRAPVARAVHIGVLAGLARVSAADRFSIITAFVQMAIQLMRNDASQESTHAN
jgi:hypothetical protein